MSLTTITGTLQDSGGQLLNGELWVTADTAFVDADTTPDTVILPQTSKSPVSSGVVNIQLHQSETLRVTYHFQFFRNLDAPATGVATTALIDFHSFVPNIATVDFSNLIPTGISTDNLDTAIGRLAQLFTTVSDYVNILRGGPRFLGVYDSNVFYQLNDAASYAGSSWIWISATPSAGQTPAIGSSYWQLIAQKGDPGGTTQGQDTAYNATGWDGALWVPTANVLRDVIETLARANNAALTGTPTAPTAVQGTNTAQIASCAFAIAEIVARFNNAALTGTPTCPSPLLPDNSGAIVNSSWVKGVINRYSRLCGQVSSGVNGGSAVSGIQTRTLNTIEVNSGDVVALSSDTFTLRAGTYRISATAPGWKVDSHRLILWNNTAGIRIASGRPEQTNNADSVQTHALLSRQFTIMSNTDLQLRHYCQTASSTYGLGVAAGEAGINETYAVVEIWRLD